MLLTSSSDLNEAFGGIVCNRAWRSRVLIKLAMFNTGTGFILPARFKSEITTKIS